MKIFEEQILEPIVRWFRLYMSKPFFYKPFHVADFGCGPNVPFFYDLGGDMFLSYVGVDPLVKPRQLGKNAKIIKEKIEKTKLPANSFDRVVMLAVLEHVEDALEILTEAHRVLKPGGMIVLTTPTPLAKPILEFLSFRLGLISPREILEHKRYLAPNETKTLLKKAGFREVQVKTFEFRCNQLAYARK